MKKPIRNIIVATALALTGGGVSARVINLQSAFPAGLPILSDSANYFATQVKDLTNADLTIKVYEAGKLSPPFEILDNVGNGSIDAGWSYAGYWAGKMPAANLFGSIPFGPDAIKYLTWIHAGGGLKLWRDLYAPYNVVPMPCGVIISEAGGWFRKPIDSVADFKGLKFRIGGLGGRVISKLGASPTAVPAAEVYLSLETGKIDGLELSYPAIDVGAGYNKVAKNYYFPGWHQPSGFIELLINKQLWDGVKPQQRTAIEAACQAVNVWTITQASVAQRAALEKLRADGVQVKRFSPEVLNALNKAAEQVMVEESAKDPNFKKVIESYRAFSQNYDDYANLSSLR